MNVPPQRVSAIPFPDDYRLPGRPDDGAGAAAADAYRQTRFVLGGDLGLFEEAMRLQLRILRDSSHSRFRTHAYAALVALWSRAYQYLADIVLLTTRGSYASTPPLARTACEVIAAEEALRAGDMEEHSIWLYGTLKPSEQHHAFEFELGRYFSGQTLADDPVLRAVYRPASDLGRPNFGATLLQVGPESNNLRLAIAFADATFHLGWAEIALGWALALAARQTRVAIDAEGIFGVTAETRAAYADLQQRVDAATARDDRCYIEEVVEADNTRRYVVHNFRRQSGGAPKKILL
ncbi:MAG TPA: hypothetical protein VNN10_07040 [Dehalococcoidia bacterium]|nr:hypothetical protein [Dehalococcoidia bacterium]